MTSLWCLIGLMIGAATVSVLGAAFSIFGLADLFSGAALSVMVMAGALEFSKFFIAAYLHQAWSRLRWLFKTYLLISVVILSMITSMGIFGYLSSAYQEASSQLDTENIKLTSLKADQARYTTEIERINKSIEEIPASRITKKMMARKEAEPAINKLHEQINKLSQEVRDIELRVVDVKKRVGPLIYIAKAFNIDIDTVVKYLILVFVTVFDPLAICMIIAVSESLESRRRAKEKNLHEQNPQQPQNPQPQPQVYQTTQPYTSEVAKVIPVHQAYTEPAPMPPPPLMPVEFPVSSSEPLATKEPIGTAEPIVTAEQPATPEPPQQDEDIHMRFANDKKVI